MLAYLSDQVQTRAPTRSLRSSDAPLMVVHQTNTALDGRAFNVAAPSTWNSLYPLKFDYAIALLHSNDI